VEVIRKHDNAFAVKWHIRQNKLIVRFHQRETNLVIFIPNHHCLFFVLLAAFK